MITPLRRDIFTYTLATGLPALLNLAGVGLLIRLVGDGAYGRVSILTGAALMAAAYASGWLAQAMLRFRSSIAQATPEQQAQEDTLEALQLIAIACLAVPLLVWLGQAGELEPVGMVAVVWLFAAAAFYQLRLARVQAGFRPRKVLLGELLRSVAFPVGAVVAALAMDGSLTFVLSALAAGYTAAAVLLPGTRSRWQIDRAFARRVWQYGWPLGMWLGCAQLMAFADRYLVAYFTDYDTAGRYAAGFDLVRRGLMLAITPVTLAVHPALVALWQEQAPGPALKLWKRTLAWQCIGAVVVVSLYLPLAASVQRLLFDFELPFLVNLAMGLTGAAWAIALIAHKPLELEFRTRLMLGCMAAAAAAHVTACAIFIPRHGYGAGAWAACGSALLYLVLVLALGWRRTSAVRRMHGASALEGAGAPGLGASNAIST